MVASDALAVGALVAGSVFFSLVAVVGFYRLPDVYARAHAASKSETLGALLGLSAAGVAFGPGAETFRLALLALFVLVTGPTAAHAVVRSAADAGTVPWTVDRAVADGGRTDAEADETARPAGPIDDGRRDVRPTETVPPTDRTHEGGDRR
jgi:multicomponent Na+:H+ antiporter subunit G